MVVVTPRVAIVGCGLIGQKRARVLSAGSLQAVCDADERRAATLAAMYGVSSSTDWRATVARDDIDLVIVATSHDALAAITTAAAGHSKNVLVEKPAVRPARELDVVGDAVARSGAKVRVGFNHSYHRAFRQARTIVDGGGLGALTHVRARYGHGGRLGYEREWRFDPAISGGGEAIDQGMHLVDLARWFLGDFDVVAGAMPTYFWDAPVEDNAFFLLRTARGQVAQLHASWTEWKNLFSFEIFGRTGKLEIGGLGGSYGVERLAYYAMTPELGPPPTTIWEYPMGDDSWEAEYADFLDDIRMDRAPAPSFEDAAAALAIVERIYAMEKRP
ncbi:MAG: Gfo/Idh/MocA family oxidoreductase [Candidatus Elarobacter sp.]